MAWMRSSAVVPALLVPVVLMATPCSTPSCERRRRSRGGNQYFPARGLGAVAEPALSRAHVERRPCEPGASVRQSYAQVTSGKADEHLAFAVRGRRDGDRARPRRARLPHAAL